MDISICTRTRQSWQTETQAGSRAEFSGGDEPRVVIPQKSAAVENFWKFYALLIGKNSTFGAWLNWPTLDFHFGGAKFCRGGATFSRGCKIYPHTPLLDPAMLLSDFCGWNL